MPMVDIELKYGCTESGRLGLICEKNIYSATVHHVPLFPLFPVLADRRELIKTIKDTQRGRPRPRKEVLGSYL